MFLRDYLLNGYTLNQRMNRIENNVENLEEKVNAISLQIKSSALPNQGIFFDEKVFDDYVFVSDIIKKTTTEIILIDNYIDESALTHIVTVNK